VAALLPVYCLQNIPIAKILQKPEHLKTKSKDFVQIAIKLRLPEHAYIFYSIFILNKWQRP